MKIMARVVGTTSTGGFLVPFKFHFPLTRIALSVTAVQNMVKECDAAGVSEHRASCPGPPVYAASCDVTCGAVFLLGVVYEGSVSKPARVVSERRWIGSDKLMAVRMCEMCDCH